MNTSQCESGNLIIDPENEIKKLQELVKKLEIQNQLLLRQNSQDDKLGFVQPMTDQMFEPGTSLCAMQSFQSHPQTSNRSDQPSQVLRQLNGIRTLHETNTEKQNIEKHEGPKVDVSRLSLDSFGLIDIDRVSLDADDSWLYKSPKHTPISETAKSPFLWLREEFDQPTDELSSFRRSLFYKLDEVTRCADSGNTCQRKNMESKSTAGSTSKTDADLVNDQGDVTEVIGIAPIVGNGNQPRSLAETDISDPASTVQGVDLLTKPFAKDRRVSESSISNTGYQKVSSASEENLLGVKYRHADVTDVKVLAKMQEESLRMSYSSPLIASRKMLSKSLNRSSGTLVDSCDSLLSDGGLSKGLNQSTGAILETVDYAAENKTKASTPCKLLNDNRGVSKSATNLAHPKPRSKVTCSGLPKTIPSTSLPGTPYGSNQELSKPTLSTVSNTVPHRQSLPNLNRSMKLTVLKSHPSDSRLAASGKKPLSLLRQPLSSQATPMRGTRLMTPTTRTNTATNSGVRSTNASAAKSGTVSSQSLPLKKRPTTLASSETKVTRMATPASGRTVPGATTPGATTPTSKGKALAVSTKKPSTPPPPPRLSGIPKPGSLTKLSIPQRSNLQTSQMTSATNNDDDDWKEGCF